MLRNSDMFWSPTLAAVSDVALFLRDLAAELAGPCVRHITSRHVIFSYKRSRYACATSLPLLLTLVQCPPEWIATLRERDEKKDTEIKGWQSVYRHIFKQSES